MRAWGETRAIRAWVLRDIVRGRLAPKSDPRGLRLRGARIVGRLDLDNITSSVALTLSSCLLDEGCTANESRLSNFVLLHCHLEKHVEPAFSGDGLVATSLRIRNTTVRGDCSTGVVRLRAARLGGQLDCTGATLSNDAGPALNLEQLEAQGVFLHEGFSASGAGRTGAVCLLSAHIGGQLICSGASMHNNSGPALNAALLHVERGAHLNAAFLAAGAGSAAAVLLRGAIVGGQLNCGGAELRNDSGPALDAEQLQAGQHVILSDGFSAIGADERGAVHLLSAHIGSQLICNRATLRNGNGPALNAEQLQTGRDVFLCDGFSAIGAGQAGAVRLVGARIGGQLRCAGANLRNDSGPALDAALLQTERDTHLRKGFSASGAGSTGAVRLLGAHIGGQLDCSGATIRNDSGPALSAERVRVDQSLLLAHGFSATGSGDAGAINLRRAHLGGQLGCVKATVVNRSGPALIAGQVQVDQDVFLYDRFSATGGGEEPVLDLENVRVGGELIYDPAHVTHLADQACVNVDGLTYPRLPRRTPTELWQTDCWLKMLRDFTPGYAAQPYQQFAAAHRAIGHDRELRRVLIQQRRDQVQRRSITGRIERTWVRFTGLVLGYGYQPWRALIGLTIAIALAVAVALILGAHGGLAQVHTPTASGPVACTTTQEFGIGLDLGTPLISTGVRAHCDATNSATGEALTAAGWVLHMLAWSFATLFIAGFTGAVRKT